jgi:Zn-finger nucleic acid-binding protein
MPLLMCPNDNAAMQTMQRGGVEFDMCPSCRGVWLDRGELEKLMTLGRGDAAQSHAAPPPPPQPWSGEHRPPPRYDDDRRRDYDKSGYDKHGQPYKKKKGFDLLDIFD